ncbi:hypothetical protein niasHT_009003 [Heterodera trifolii]|uniref:Uncharacterized protein n=1 Tax=Heterodera trifolii TaxID=157864 RepID=A0ABD2LGE4_9BILA
MAPSLKLLFQFAIMMAVASHAFSGQSQNNSNRTTIPALGQNGSGLGSIASNPENQIKNEATNGQSGDGYESVASDPEIGTKNEETIGQSGTESVASQPENGTKNEETVGQSGTESVASQPESGIKNEETNGQSGTESIVSQPKNGTKNEETVVQSGTESVASQPESGIKKQEANGQNAYSINPFAQRMRKLFLVRKKRSPLLVALGTGAATFLANAATKVQGIIVDGIAKMGMNVICTMGRDICECGKGACIEHPGWESSICCGKNFELKCCVDAPPEIVQVSRACKKEKKDCSCGWGKCIRSAGDRESECCAEGYAFQCCTTEPTTTPTTTLPPEYAAELLCTQIARACSCGWAKCIEEEGAKQSFCCKAGRVQKCCVDPQKEYKMVKRETGDLVSELRQKDECSGKNHTCFCGIYPGLQGAAGLKFLCCDSSSVCSCCEMDWPLHKPTLDFVLPVAKSAECDAPNPHTLSYCVSSIGTTADNCCPDNYRYSEEGYFSYHNMELCDASKNNFSLDCPSGKWPLVIKRYQHYHDPAPIIVRTCRFQEKPMVLESVVEACKKRSKIDCPSCGWAKCVSYPGYIGSGCCPDEFIFQCCANELQPPIAGGWLQVTVPTKSTTEILPTISPNENATEEPNNAVNLLSNKMCCALASFLAMTLHFVNNQHPL